MFTSFHVRFDLQAPRHRLVVVQTTTIGRTVASGSRLDVRFDLQAASNRLIVIVLLICSSSSGFYLGSNFHVFFPSLENRR
jgi:hypothetical protein